MDIEIWLYWYISYKKFYENIHYVVLSIKIYREQMLPIIVFRVDVAMAHYDPTV